MLEVRNINYRYGRNEVLHNVSFKVEQGEFVCVLGPNGSGKTTLLKNILGLLTPDTGTVLIEGEDVRKMPPSKLAKIIGYIPQAHTPPFPFRVFDVVLMGRAPYLTSLSVPSDEDERIAYESLEELNITRLKDKPYTEISGGERQLVLIARALAQKPKILVMDEPAASLDFGNQSLFLEYMRTICDKGMSILMVTHDPHHALFCADKVVMLKNGRIVKMGPPQTTIEGDTMREIYRTDVRVARIKLSEKRTITVCVPVPSLLKTC
ncbi:ABC transporter, ATP binding protein [Thermacetogenium phaeum DSM 12270]|uniref:ABC transporter, ATP binding protein n=1 Tax=Thermacetogenium phaeum (strain ATCC BAA-254 / DSM 26808 / PB) TaxID=1089553 RepID=K4LQN0_THEPS|nr:ABC transporter ATP-binding protein [Thermacetogenium phaeum]AFV10404.1 ABC transporter, ATP binding protein [Thermacetogenium phaeum DSM 12270]